MHLRYQRPARGRPARLTCYAKCNEVLAAHPLYLRDADDSFDQTYATFYFRAPAFPAMREALAAVAGGPVDMSERWKAAIERVGTGELRPGGDGARRSARRVPVRPGVRRQDHGGLTAAVGAGRAAVVVVMQPSGDVPSHAGQRIVPACLTGSAALP